MFLQSLASAFPEARFTQRECWDIVAEGRSLDTLDRRSRKILETILKGDSGIDTRHFAIPPDQLFTLDAEGLNNAFEREAPLLGRRALDLACTAAGVRPSDIDALIVCTCSGYLCPGVSSHVAEQAAMRGDAHLCDLTGLGCGAAIPSMRTGAGFLAANPGALVATLAVEICSAAFYLDGDPGVLVSACLFGDGAAAALWRGDGRPGQWRAGNFRSLHRPEEREKIRFVNAGGKLRNQLDRTVPALAAESVGRLFALRTADPDAVITHTGGRDVINEVERELVRHPLPETRSALRKYGNLSSPSVLVALEERLGANAPDQLLWLSSFGAGFTAHACEMRRNDEPGGGSRRGN